MKLLSLIVCLILTVGYVNHVEAVTDAELEALQKQLEQQEAEEKKQAEAEEKKKAEKKAKSKADLEKQRLEEAKRVAEEKRKAEEAQRQKDAEAKRVAEEKRKVEEARLAVLERQRQEEEAKKRVEEEKKEKYNLLISTTQEDYTTRAGGTGGPHEFNSSCGTNMVMYGVGGYSGSFVTSVGAMCTEIDINGNWTTNKTNIQASRTDALWDKGELTKRTCPSGWAISGFEGRSGAWLDQLKFKCRKLGEYGEFIQGGQTQTLSQFGGNGGTSFSTISCGHNKPVRAIAGKSGWYVDSVYMQCAVPQVSTD